MERVLLIDDDAELCGLVTRFMAGEGFVVDSATNGGQGVQQALSGEYRLILLDVMMPDMNGFDVLRRIRAESRLPVLMLTAKGDTLDRVLGLEMGADDYLPKPFEPPELAARVRAILRRTSLLPDGLAPSPASIVVADLELDAGTRTVRKKGTIIDLTTVEFDLLATLVRTAGSTVSREDLARDVLGRSSPAGKSMSP